MNRGLYSVLPRLEKGEIFFLRKKGEGGPDPCGASPDITYKTVEDGVMIFRSKIKREEDKRVASLDIILIKEFRGLS